MNSDNKDSFAWSCTIFVGTVLGVLGVVIPILCTIKILFV